jgi:transposase
MALRGINLLAATTIVAEIGDLTRFASAPQLMAYLGVVPSEHSSGAKKSRGGITKTGNGHVRILPVEAAWSYRHPARKTKVIQRRAVCVFRLIVPALAAAQAQKAVGQDAGFEEGVKLVFDELRQLGT